MTNHLIFPVSFLRALDDSVTELEDAANGFVSLVHMVSHAPGTGATRTIHRYTQEIKYLEGETQQVVRGK